MTVAIALIVRLMRKGYLVPLENCDLVLEKALIHFALKGNSSTWHE